MKKIILVCAAIGLLTIGTVNAQDSTRTQQTTPSSTMTQQPDATMQQQPSDQYLKQNYSTLKPADLPASLRTTFKGTEYKGWENGSLYRSNNNSGYMLRTGTGDQTQNFYFDKNGKRMEGPGTSMSPSPSPTTPATPRP